MRWLVLVLVVANVAVFFWFAANDEGNVRSVDEGRLPRVAEIELIDHRGEQESANLPAVSDDLPAEAVESPGVAQAVAEPAPEIQAGPNAASPAKPRQYYAVGWFEEEAGARSYQQALSAADADDGFKDVRECEEALEPFHWVIIPPLESREAALARYRQLVSQGIEAYVVPSGQRENAISLGLFRSLPSAERVLQRRQAQNINAILVKFPRNRISYALVFEGVPPASFAEFTGASVEGGSGLQLIEISDCEGVATAEKNP